MTEALARPSLEVFDRLGGLGAIEVPTQVLAADDAEDLDIDYVRGRLIVLGGQPVADRLRARPSDQHLTQARGVNHQHQATGRAAHRAPLRPRPAQAAKSAAACA